MGETSPIGEKENLSGRWAIGFQSLIDLTIFGIKSLITVNGGALIVLFGFIGNSHILEKVNVERIPDVFSGYFYGLGLALLCLLFAYFFQVVELEWKCKYLAAPLRVLAVLIAMGSFGCFLWGSHKAIDVFTSFPIKKHHR